MHNRQKCSMLGPLLFNIFLNDLLLVITHFYLSNYTDGNTLLLYCFGNNINDPNDKSRIDLMQILEKFNENYMVLNADKCN